MATQQNHFTDTIIMVRPTRFCCNSQTAVNNYYQKQDATLTKDPNIDAQQEFDAFVAKLRSAGITPVVLQDPRDDTPDSVFPNNHIYFTPQKLALFPMFAENRRLERLAHPAMLEQLTALGFDVPHIVVDYTPAELEATPRFLESTGAMVVDKEHNICFAAISPRCDKSLVEQFCKDFGYTPQLFSSYQTCGAERKLIYHTNVMMAVAQHFAIVALSTIDDEAERNALIHTLTVVCKKQIVDISEEQVNNFLGNALQLQNAQGENFLIMSTTAHNALTADQKAQIEQYCTIIHSRLDIIETLGGGSARCMALEVFLNKK